MSPNYVARWVAYLMRKGRRVLRRPIAKLTASASETRELQAGESSKFPPSITIDGQISKITGNLFGPVSEYIEYATQENVVHRPTLAYRVEDVVYDNGHLYKGLVAEHISSLGRPTIEKPLPVETMLLCSSSSGSQYFGDWLLADNLLDLLADEMGIRPLKVWPHSAYPHIAELNNFLGLRETYERGVLHIKNLFIIDDTGYNAGKRRRLARLRATLRERLEGRSNGPRLVYICRGSGFVRERALLNEEEVISFLSSQGFAIVDPSQHSAKEVLLSTLDSTVVAGIEGSQLGYGFLGLKEGGFMLALQPPYHFQSAFRPRCASVGIDWGFIVGDECPGGFTIDINSLRTILAEYAR